MLKKIAKIIGLILAGLGFLWFMLPLLIDGYGKGSMFGQAICLLAALLILLYGRLVKKKGFRKFLARALLVCYMLGLGWTAYLTVLMSSAQVKTPPPGTNVILLGAQVLAADQMSLALAQRVNAAYAYLVENPEAKCIVTGGQGSNEPATEASVEKYFLMKKGIAENRIFLEDQSKNTRENLQFALEIAQRENMGTTFAIATQNFHLFRSIKLAEELGMQAYGIPAETSFILFPGFYGWELMSLTKWHIQVLLGV